MQDAESLHCKISIICLALTKRSDLTSVNPVLGAQCGAESGKCASTWRAGIFSKAVTWLAIGHYAQHGAATLPSTHHQNLGECCGWIRPSRIGIRIRLKRSHMYKLRLTDLLICCICSIFSPSVSKKKCCKWIL